jgi:hypothetical protein
MRFDADKKVFICWNCCKLLTFEEAKQILPVFNNFDKTKLFGDGYD